MITWMQKHKKYLIVTIWVSTISFIGAGFVGWGQYSYGDKAGAVAKVGDIELTQAQLQKSYSNLYSQYSQLFNGDFDEQKAKAFGLQRQALKDIIDRALILNLAKSYDLTVNDNELVDALISQPYFLNNGKFDKEVYKRVLSRANLTMAEYEKSLKEQLLIEKTLKLLTTKANKNEENILSTLINIADKIKYKILTKNDIKIDLSDEALKKFWEKRKNDFKTVASYEIEYIVQEPLKLTFDNAKISKYYQENRFSFKDSDGKILKLEDVKDQVIAKLNQKASKNEALKTYIAYKKDRLSSNIKKESANISKEKNILNDDALKKVSSVISTPKVLKPILIDGKFYIIKVITKVAPRVKTFQEAKSEVINLYKQEATKDKLLELANRYVKNFKGKTTDFFTMDSAKNLDGLNLIENNEFIQKLFDSDKKRSFIVLNSGKIVIFEILAQKLLQDKHDNLNDTIVKLKSAIFNKGLINNLQNKYNTEIYIEGL